MSQSADRPSPRADLWSAIFWVVLGGAIVVASWRMDRLAHQGAPLYTVPGLVPGLLGAMLALLGVLLGVRAVRASPGAVASAGAEGGGLRVGGVLALCLGYAVGMVGNLPFWLGTFLFVAAFVLIFEYPMRRERGQIARGVLVAAIHGAATSAVVSLVFERVFYVRLP